MRIRKKNISKDGSGHVDILAETADDMWHVLNLVQAGDEVRAGTYRKVGTRNCLLMSLWYAEQLSTCS